MWATFQASFVQTSIDLTQLGIRSMLAGSNNVKDLKRKDVLLRTKSEAALPGGPSERNSLTSLGPEAALQCIASYLESSALR